MANLQSGLGKRDSIITSPKIFSNLKMKSNYFSTFVSADELSRLRDAYLAAKAKSDADKAEADRAIAAKAEADRALREKKQLLMRRKLQSLQLP
jgi:hypothetical protein